MMPWLFAILIVLALGAVAVVAAGRGAPMAPVYDDRADVRLPEAGALRAGDLREVRFTTAVRGYNMAEVDELLARLAAQMEAAQPPPAELEQHDEAAPSPPGEVESDRSRGTNETA